MKKLVSDQTSVLSRYSGHTRDEVVAVLDSAIASLPEASRSSARFEIDIENFPYDNTDYPALFMKYERPETDAEETKREASEAASVLAREKREREEFERLSAKFGSGRQS